MIILGVDLHGTVIDDTLAKMRVLERNTGRKLKREQAIDGCFKHLFPGGTYSRAMHDLFTTDLYLQYCEPKLGAIEALSEITSCSGVVVEYISTARGLSMERAKNWLEMYGLTFRRVRTNQTSKLVLYSVCAFVIDDEVRHFEQDLLKRKGVKPILFRDARRSIPTNLDSRIKVATSWQEVNRLVDFPGRRRIAA